MVKNLFAYGLCKVGHTLDLNNHGCKYVGDALIPGAVLHQIGYGVGLRFSKNPIEIVYGEVFEVPDSLWAWLDEIEGNGKNFQRRLITTVVDDPRDGLKEIEAWVYESIYFSDEGYKHLPILKDGKFEKFAMEAARNDRPDEASWNRGIDNTGLVVNSD